MKVKKLLKIGMIVRSADEAVIHYEQILGIGPWDIQILSGEESPMSDLMVNGVSHLDGPEWKSCMRVCWSNRRCR